MLSSKLKVKIMKKYPFTLWCKGHGSFAMKATSSDACRRQFRRHWPQHKDRAVLVTRDKRNRPLTFVFAMQAWMDDYGKYQSEACDDMRRNIKMWTY